MSDHKGYYVLALPHHGQYVALLTGYKPKQYCVVCYTSIHCLVRTRDSERLQVLASSQLVLAVAVQVLCAQARGGEQDGQQ